MNTKTRFPGRGLRRLLAAFLCLLTVAGLLPTSAFAASAGMTASSWVGDPYASSDGGTYYHPAPWHYMAYHADGTTSYGSYNGGNSYKHYMLTDANGETHSTYCVESGIDFEGSDNGYLSESGKNSQYLSLLPAAAREGIMLASLYGWQPGTSVPIPGINADDWKMAAQCIIWEYQQQLRSDPYSRHDNGPVSADQYYGAIAGRPAEAAYHWILERIASHSVIPSFASEHAGSAPVLELEWDTADKVYRLTVTDTNNLYIDLQALSGSGITVSRSGNSYTFTSTQMIEDPVSLHYRKDIPVSGNMLIWGRPGYQTMMTGAEDPVSFYVRIKTETYGIGRIAKTSEDGIVEGISLTITGNGVDRTVTTGTGGSVDTELLPGTYLVTEQPIERYVTPAAQYVTIESGQTSTVHFSNVLKKFRVHLTKTDADTGYAQGDASLAGAQYGLYKDSELVDVYTTDAGGSFMTRYYVCGDDWTIREIEPSTGYLLDETVHEVGASAGLYEVELNTTENHVTEQVVMGNIRLVKHTDDPDPEVYGEEDAQQAVPEEEPAAAVISEDVPADTEPVAEPVTEESAPAEDLAKDTAEMTAGIVEPDTADTDGTVSGNSVEPADTSSDTEESTDLADEVETDSPEADPSVSGNDAGEPEEPAGEAVADAGTESAQEPEPEQPGMTPIAPEDLDVDDTAGIVEKPEAGAVFEIYLQSAGSFDAARESERDILTTDSDGFASSRMLPYGRYTVHQVEGADGKAFVPDFTVFICEDGQTYSYILNNDAITARIRVEKHDAETGNIIPLAGTGFRIRDLSTGEFITQTIYYPNPMSLDIFYVSDEGWLMLPEPLEAGDFELLEVAAPYGYVLSSEPIPFTVDGSEAIVTVTQSNMPQKGRITITKTGEVFASVEENDGFYQAVFEPRGLPGAVYDLIADEDIYTGDGTLRVAKDTVVETLTTGEDARAVSSLVYLGRYRLEERQAPHGMVLDAEPVFVELSYAGQTVSVVENETGLYNMRQKASVSLTKGMETDELFGIGLADEYKDVSFGLYAAHDLTALDGSVIPAGALMEAVTLSPVEGEDGTYAADFAADLPFGGFFVQERTTGSAYVLDDTEYPVAFGYAGQDVAVVEIVVNEGEAIHNDLIRGRIDGKKYGEDPAGGEDILLDGALMGLFAADTEGFSEENALLTVTTAEGGAFAFEDVPYGHWIVAEVAAPDLYSISDEQHHIYIGTDGQRIAIRVDNDLIRGSVQLVKTEAVDEPSALEDETDNPFMRRLAGAVFMLYEDTNGDKKLNEGDTLMGTLAETEAGFHKAEGLLAKGFFVLEHEAPKGYQRDENAYYFEITQDGQAVVIENGEAGRGFANEAYRGNLRIVKDSSDGRKDGFAFEIKSADGAYCETFTSGETGVIEVEGLRAGKYTVTELSNRASRDYILPDAATVEIRAGETSTVQFFNERPEDGPEEPTTPGKPVPQTGDNNNMYIWIGLLALAAAGGGTFAVLWLNRGRGRHEKKNTGLKRDKAAMAAVFLICAALFVGSGFMLARELGQYKAGADTYGQAADFVTLPESDPVTTQESEAQNEATETEGETGVVNSAPSFTLPEVDFTALKEKGPEVAAWLTLPDTVINYPVAHTDDNDYYLTHLYDGTANKAGCLFIDYENAAAFTDKNTVIYGHNMRDGSMFASLKEFSSQEYFDAHPFLYLVTPEGGYLVELFAAFAASPGESGSEDSPWTLFFKDDGAYTTWLSAMQERSLVTGGASVTSSDNVLTLSTCTNSGSDRFIVMGKLVPVE